ncbi:MAG: PEGA domain-containing protein [Candidatus Roizmanbacteria bacterium]
MKGKLGLLIGLFFVFVAIIIGTYFFFSYKAVNGKLEVRSSPSAKVLLNNKELGTTPYEGSVKQGEYTLTLQPTDTSTESSPWTGKITITKGKLTYVDRDLGKNELSSSGIIITTKEMESKPETSNTGEIEVTVDPQGARISLDGDEQGQAPLTMHNISAGNHEVIAASTGFFRKSRKVKVETNLRIIMDIKLAVDESQKDIDALKKEQDEASTSASLTPTASPTGGKTTPAPTKATTSKITPTVALTPSKITPTTGSTTATGQVLIGETGTGWLRVRSEPSASSTELAKVDTGKSFPLVAEQSGWYKIEYETGKTGWISAQYATKK